MSAQFVWSAQDVCRMRLCAAAGCPDEASGSGIALCARHDREHRAGLHVKLHVTPEPGEPVLWCSTCKQDKPDREFSTRAATKGSTQRRGRYYACRDCESRARRADKGKRLR